MADRYFVAGGVDNNWGTTGNWSASSGGAGGETVPTSSDAVFFDASSPNCDVNASARVCLSLDFTGYTNTITMSQNLTVSGSITLAAGMTVSGTGYLAANANATLTSNGKAWKNLYLYNATFTLADAWTVDNLKLGSYLVMTVNGFSITTMGDFDLSAASNNLSGTTTIIMGGTGNVILGYSIGLPFVINTAGTITFGSGTFALVSTSLTYTAGTVDCSDTKLSLGGSGSTLDTGGSNMQWGNFATFGYTYNTITFTLKSDLYVSGNVDFGFTTGPATFNGNKIYVGGNCGSSTLTSGSIAGTTVIHLTGTGDWSCPKATTGRIANEVVVNTSGTITIAETSGCLNLGDWTLTAGTLNIDGQDFVIGGGGGGTQLGAFENGAWR